MAAGGGYICGSVLVCAFWSLVRHCNQCSLCCVFKAMRVCFSHRICTKRLIGHVFSSKASLKIRELFWSLFWRKQKHENDLVRGSKARVQGSGVTLRGNGEWEKLSSSEILWEASTFVWWTDLFWEGCRGGELEKKETLCCSIQKKNHFMRACYPHSPPVFIQLCPQAPKRCLIIRGLCNGIYSMFIHNASYGVSYIRRVGDDSLLHLITQHRNIGAQRRLSLHEHQRTLLKASRTQAHTSPTARRQTHWYAKLA